MTQDRDLAYAAIIGLGIGGFRISRTAPHIKQMVYFIFPVFLSATGRKAAEWHTLHVSMIQTLQ